MNKTAKSWTALTAPKSAPPAFLESFLREEVDNGLLSSCATPVRSEVSAEGADTDSEYGDIDWCSGDQVFHDSVESVSQRDSTDDVAVPTVVTPQESQMQIEDEPHANPPATTLQSEACAADVKRPSTCRTTLDPEERRRRAKLRRLAAERHGVLTLCFISRLRVLNDACDDLVVQAMALSRIPDLVGKADQFAQELRAFLQTANKTCTRSRVAMPSGHRFAFLSALTGTYTLSTEQEALLLVARCRAVAIPSRVVMEVPLPSAKSCAALLAGGELPCPRVWAEIFDVKVGRWIPSFADKSEMSTLMACPWILAAGSDAQVCDVTERYCARWTGVVSSRGSLSRGWNNILTFFGQAPCDAALDETVSADLNLLDKRHLARRSQREALPRTAAGFKRHAGYVLETQLRQNEVVYPASAKPVGLFKGKEPIWRRTDVAELRTPAQWRRSGRLVREAEQAHKILRSETVFASSLFGQWQTEELPQSQNIEEGSQHGVTENLPIPGSNQYGNLEFLTAASRANIKAHLPRGTVYINDEAARGAVAKLQPSVPFALAVVGFRHEPGHSKPQPTYGGVVVWSKDESAVRAGIAEQQEQLAKDREKREAQRARQLCVGRKSWQRLSVAPCEVDLL